MLVWAHCVQPRRPEMNRASKYGPTSPGRRRGFSHCRGDAMIGWMLIGLILMACATPFALDLPRWRWYRRLSGGTWYWVTPLPFPYITIWTRDPLPFERVMTVERY